MNKRKIVAWLLAATAVIWQTAPVCAAALQTQAHEVEVPQLEEGTYVKGEALVSMTTTQAAALTKEGTASFDKDIRVEECWEFGTAQDAQSEQIKDYVALVSSDTYSTKELMEIAADRYYVDAVAPNSYAHLCDIGKDTLSDYQWYLDGTGSFRTESKGIRFSDLEAESFMQPVVALIDTGVDYTNEDLKDSMWVNPYQSKGVEGTYGYDFANDDDDPMDTDGHGTHCAGVIAAQQNNAAGITGISNAKIMALKVVKDNSDVFDVAGAIRAFEYIVRAQEMGVPVAAVNCSWGGSRDSGAVLNTLIDKMGANGALTVFAAGNDSIDWDAIPMSLRTVPYDLDSKYVVVAGASDENDERVYFSDYGNTQVDLFAPGSNIVSTVQEAKFLPQFWTPEKRQQMTTYYNTVSSIDDFYTASNIRGLGSDYTVRLSYEPKVGCSDQTDGSLKYTVKNNRSFGLPIVKDDIFDGGMEQAGFIYLDVTDWNPDTEKTYYISCMMADNDGDGVPAWESVEKVSTKDDCRFVTSGGRTYLALIGITTQKTRSTTYYFDNFAVSVADPDTDQFEKCDIMSGSSMAAPMVTGAVAVLRGVNPTYDAMGIRSLLMECTRSVDALENACVTGGILDLSGIVVQPTSLKLNKASANVRYGNKLQLVATILPENAAGANVTWKSSNPAYASVSAKGVVKVKKAGVGKTVKITASTKDGIKLQDACTVKILKAKNKK
ncbi:hypothetical protein C823_000500 [Eubacterium plexicaudatum ASF492]|nr:hypothetical protein C823_000500 [Eubacterium plexicaudatum ASF492]